MRATHYRLQVWEVASGQPVFDRAAKSTFSHNDERIDDPYPYNWSVAISGDGRVLAAGGRVLDLWDLKTGIRRVRYPHLSGPKDSDYVQHVAFIPNHDLVATTAYRQTCQLTLWKVPPPDASAQPPTPPDADALDRLWLALRDADAGKARQAMWTLTDTPGQSVPFLAKQLRPADTVDDAALRTLIADLDHAKFAVRLAARDRLAELGTRAEPAVRAALAAGPTPEARKLLGEALAVIDKRQYSPEQLRQLRAVEALERIGSADAIAILKTLAKGADADPQTEDARDALKRLEARK